ncbi:hypothetical protein C8R43DRAFT_962923 [Mycena crocata]|nr:hypothetical protein C8R43DRAFT_962923 [Mycena crocata]
MAVSLLRDALRRNVAPFELELEPTHLFTSESLPSSMTFPDHKLRLEHIAALNALKLALEQRMTKAQAELDSIRDRYDLDDDDLAFEVEMRPSEEAVCWDAELEILKEERRRIISCIEHSEKFCEEYNVADLSKAPLYPEPEEEEEYLVAADYIAGEPPPPSPISPTMPKKKPVLRQLRRAHSPAPSTDRGAEVRERRRLEVADATNAGDVKTWVSDSWNAAMDGFLESDTPGDAEEPDDAVDGVSMDSGLSDESDSQSDSLDATQIVCQRSYPRGDPLEAAWDALTIRLWPMYEMPAGVRQSLHMEHPSRSPRKAEMPKVQLFEGILTSSDSDVGAHCINGHDSLAIEVDQPEGSGVINKLQ